MTVTSPKPRADSPPFVRYEQIVEAARTAIEEHDPEALTGQIAKRAGLARPNVYRHFSSKDDLDHAIALSAYQELRAEIRTRLDLCGTRGEHRARRSWRAWMALATICDVGCS